MALGTDISIGKISAGHAMHKVVHRTGIIILAAMVFLVVTVLELFVIVTVMP